MNALFSTKTFIALAVIAATGCAVTQPQAQEQSAPPMAEAPSAPGLPANIIPGSPLAEVIKMVQAGVDAATIQSYIANAQGPFQLDADKIVFLKDEGVPSELINAMMERDKAFAAPVMVQQPPPQPAPVQVTTVAAPETVVAPVNMAPPPAEVTVDYFHDTLSPYGSWVDVDGYGRCWRPTTVIYDSSWSPYGDRGHWVYTDYGWYWDSDYSWGMTFHYGRWFRNPRFGWCWYPDTVWAPSWVTWRSGGDYCGWAPLPPFAVYEPGGGFFYRGAHVGVDFDFGLGVDCFLFVSSDHFCDRRPRNYFVPRERVTEVYHHTTIINNYNVSSRTIVNRGIGVDHIASATHRPIEPVHLNSLPNAGRQGFRGEGFQANQHVSGNNNHSGAVNNNNPGHAFSATGGNTPSHPGSGQFDTKNNAGAVHGNNSGGVVPLNNHVDSIHANNNAGSVHLNNNSGGTVPLNNHVDSIHANNNATSVHVNNSAISGSQGSRSGYQTDAYHSQSGAQHIQSQGSAAQGSGNTFNQPPSRHLDTYTAPAGGASQGGVPQTRSFNNSTVSGSQQHGAEQLQQGSSATSGPHVNNSGTSQNQPQPRTSGNGGNGGGNGGGSNGPNGRSGDKQNQNR